MIGSTFAQAPSGSITNVVVGSTNALWDMSYIEGLQFPAVEAGLTGKQSTNLWQFIQGTTDTSDVPTNGNKLSISGDTYFVQTGGGRLVGKGTNTVHLSFATLYFTGNIFQLYDWTNVVDLPLTGDYVNSGSVFGVQGTVITKLRIQMSGQALLSGKIRKVHALRGIYFMKRNTNRVLVESVGNVISVSGQPTLSAGGSGGEALPDYGGDGTWTLVLNFDPAAPTAPTKLSGTATVTLHNDAATTYPFHFTGRYIPKTGQSTLLLKGVAGDGSTTFDGRGATLTVTLANGQVTRLLGRVGGQAINRK